ncbi:MAG: hypothetical protein ABIO00_02400, partial [Candidatus Paceibacterota bacterium]
YVVSDSLFHKEMYQELIQSEHITVTKQGSGSDTFPWYGENTSYYYVIYPAVNYRILRSNSCSSFDAFNIDTWCGEERYFPRCNTPTKPNNCMSYSAQK